LDTVVIVDATPEPFCDVETAGSVVVCAWTWLVPLKKVFA
jgi:hypothetical protein